MTAASIRPGRLSGLMAVVLVLAACSRLPGAAPATATPSPGTGTPATRTQSAGTQCETQYPAARCLAMAELAIGLMLDPEDVASVMIVPDPTIETIDGKTILRTYGGAPPIFVEVTLKDGSSRQTMMCAGIPSGPACTNDPRLALQGIVPGDGYRDTPCAGEPPDGCATPLPMPDSKSVAAARPISIERVAVPIDRVGSYEVELGRGSLPNGILTSASYALGDDWPDDVSITDATIRLEVRSLEPDGRAFQNYYQHGWREGTERIRAVLVFGVMRFDPGAVLDVRDIVVR